MLGGAGQTGLERCSFSLRDGVMAGLRFGSQAGPPPTLIFLHATGFNARTYRRVLEPIHGLGSVLAVDLRGHGCSTLLTTMGGYSSWDIHCQDVLELMDRHVQGPVLLAGHSMGATVALLAAAQRPQRVRALCLIEPVILLPLFYMLGRAPGASFLRRRWGPMQKVAKRRAHFASLEEAMQRLTGRGVFASFSPESLRDYLGDGLRPAGDGGVELACSPAFEAATYAAQGHAPFAALKRYLGPIHALRAERGSTFLPRSVSIVAARRPDIVIETVPSSGHMLPIEQPHTARAALEAMISAHQPLAR